MKSVDLNCDVGEGAGRDAELMPWITSANIACGAHAGDLASMIATVELARRHGVAVGAHPGHYDPDNFGRIERPLSPEEAGRLVVMQLEQMFEVAGARLRHVKLHGALYHQVAHTPRLAEGVVAELSRLWPDLILFAPAGSSLVRIASGAGLRVAEEVFADRTYQRDGRLTPRGRPDALILDEAAAVAQVLAMVRDGVVRATDGTEFPIMAETVCLHGDQPQTPVFAQRLRKELEDAGIVVKAFAA